MADPSFAELIAVEEAGDNIFISKTPPRSTGKNVPFAYGGCTIALAMHAACKTVEPKFHIFSVLGSFLGPSRVDQRVHCKVIRIRDTRTFATRQVVAVQYQEDGKERVTSQMFIDFHVKEPALLTYWPPLPKEWGNPTDGNSSLPAQTVIERAITAGRVPPAGVQTYFARLGMIYDYTELRHCVEGMGVQNVFGLDKDAETTQDHLPIHQRFTAEWTRLKISLKTYAENVSSLGFMMDAGLSFVALQHSRMSHGKTPAASTLDFALRIMTDEIDPADWMMRDRRTLAGSNARTFAESNLYTRDGKLVAVMSQTCILRPAPPKNVDGKNDRQTKL